MDRLRRSWDLARQSFAVLRSDKELLLFPLFSFLALLVVLVVFALPFIGIIGTTPEDGRVNNVALYVLGFVFYVVTYTVTFFFQTALVGAALIRLDGRDPTLGDGLRIAVSRLPTIVAYAVIAATVGQILRWISERSGILGPIVSGIIGFAWAVATFLVVPVLAAEGIGPIAAIKRSGSLLRQTWGEQLVGNLGIGLIFGIIGFAVLIVGGFAIVALASSTALLLAAVVVVLLALGIIGLVGSALSGIYQASVYRYATTGSAGSAFDATTLASAFRSKSGGPAPRYGMPG